MPPDLLSFIRKIPVNYSTYKLEWQSLSVDKKYFELKELFPDFEYSKLLPLALLVQHLPLSLFTKEELTAVSNLSLNLLSITTSNNIKSKTLSVDKPLFDTSSSRVYKFINTLDTVNTINFQLAATYLNFNSSTLQEIILKLYTKGF